MRTQVAPTHTVHRGTVAVSGYWFDGRALSPQRAVRRLLHRFEAGSRVYSVPEGVVMIHAAAHQATAEESPAACLVREGEILSSAPLRPSERAALPPGTAIALVQAGIVHALQPSSLEPIEPSAWLDLTTYEIETTTSLGGVTEPRERAADAPSAETLFNPRIGRTEADRARQRELVTALTKIEAQPQARSGQSVSALLANIWQAAKSWWRARSRPARSASGPSSQPFTFREAGLFARFLTRVSAFFKFLVWRSRLMARLGRKQAEWMAHLLELLDRQQDLEVLKHAIPLSDGRGEPGAPALLPPAPRTDLAISLFRRGGGSSLFVADELMLRLRTSYEAVFQRLDRDGKHDEAAFVLAELLNDPSRAVAYLERHGRLVLAAELAEARKLPAGLLVRQWFLAGNRERALAIAIRENAFADAIDRLERSGKKGEADGLRLLQADRLASGGLLVAAARAVKSVESAQPLALRWLEVARSTGDYLGIALELELDARRFDAVWADVAALLGPDASGESDARARVRLGEQLLSDRVPVTRSIAREVARELLADSTEAGGAAAARTAQRLAEWVRGPFRADQPEFAGVERRTPPGPVRHVFDAQDVGSRPISDVCAVGSRYAVACGEGGVALVRRDGRRIAHFDLPAERLVVARDCPHLLAVSRRGDACAVGRIHFGTRRSERWTELRAGAFAPTFDGTSWVVAVPGGGQWTSELQVLDVVESRPAIIRRVPLFDDASVSAIAIGEHSCNVIAAEAFGQLERLRYELPGWTLRMRSSIECGSAPEHGFMLHACSADADRPTAVWQQWVTRNGYLHPEFFYGSTSIDLVTGDLAGIPTLVVNGDHFAVVVAQRERVRVAAGLLALRRPTLDIELAGTRSATARLSDGILVLGDDCGRLLKFDVVSGRCLESIRIN